MYTLVKLNLLEFLGCSAVQHKALRNKCALMVIKGSKSTLRSNKHLHLLNLITHTKAKSLVETLTHHNAESPNISPLTTLKLPLNHTRTRIVNHGQIREIIDQRQSTILDPKQEGAKDLMMTSCHQRIHCLVRSNGSYAVEIALVIRNVRTEKLRKTKKRS